MTFYQRLAKWAYPLLMRLTRRSKRSALVLQNHVGALPSEPFHTLTFSSIHGKPVHMSDYVGRKILLVNTASNCGYTAQYVELQELWERYSQQLTIIAFPSNDFGAQEKGSNADIAAFCRNNYHPGFPLAEKSVVKKGPEQHPVYRWLTDKEKNGWNNQAPSWNFSKYLVNEEGLLTHYFGPSVSPLDKVVLEALAL